MSFITFFPSDLHLDLLTAFIDIFLTKLSNNARDQLLSYYYHLAVDKDKQKDQKCPKYMEAILNNNFSTSINNNWSFIYENDNRNQNSDEEIIEDDDNEDDLSPIKIIATLAKKYNLKAPSI